MQLVLWHFIIIHQEIQHHLIQIFNLHIINGSFDIDIGKGAVVSNPWDNQYGILDMIKGTSDVNVSDGF